MPWIQIASASKNDGPINLGKGLMRNLQWKDLEAPKTQECRAGAHQKTLWKASDMVMRAENGNFV